MDRFLQPLIVRQHVKVATIPEELEGEQSLPLITILLLFLALGCCCVRTDVSRRLRGVKASADLGPGRPELRELSPQPIRLPDSGLVVGVQAVRYGRAD